MIHWRLRLRLRLTGQRGVVPVNQCVHYGGFRYGRSDEHPYETYVRLLDEQGSAEAARIWLVDFLQHYRPLTLEAGLGLKVAAAHALWCFPWERKPPVNAAWMQSPSDLPDIVTHYSEKGVPWDRIEEEFSWLEKAYYSIRSKGFQPKMGPPLVVRRLMATDGDRAYLVLDGNHRLSALVVLGYEQAPVSWLHKADVKEADLDSWPQVVNGLFSIEEARAIFRAYFQGNPRWRLAPSPAPLLGTPSQI